MRSMGKHRRQGKKHRDYGHGYTNALLTLNLCAFLRFLELTGLHSPSSTFSVHETLSILLSPDDKLASTQYQRQTILLISDDHDLRVRGGCEFLSRFDSFPFQQSGRDSLGHNRLEVLNALGLYALSVGFLFLFLQLELHSERFLFGGLLQLDRTLE